ncbi:MAG TPA: phosphate ABC transporter permease subunit PstC [Thermoanaerobaculia bacterium]
MSAVLPFARPAALARRLPRRPEGTRLAAFALAGLGAAVFAGLVALFAAQSLPAWREAGLGYLAGTRWFYRAREFGALPMVYGTFVVSAVALAVAAPLGLGAAICTAELLPRRARLLVKLAVELLAAVPSVVYGLLGVLLLRGWVARLLAPWEPLSGDTLLTAGLLLAVMVLPTVTTLADDALRGVPAAAREGARALGLNQSEAIVAVVLRQARPGLLSAVLLGLGRALGETIAVFLIVGRQDNQWPERLLSFAPLAGAGQTLTTKLGSSEAFIAYGDPLHWGALVGLGLVLLVMVGGVSIAGAWLAAGGRARA